MYTPLMVGWLNTLDRRVLRPLADAAERRKPPARGIAGFFDL